MLVERLVFLHRARHEKVRVYHRVQKTLFGHVCELELSHRVRHADVDASTSISAPSTLDATRHAAHQVLVRAVPPTRHRAAQAVPKVLIVDGAIDPRERHLAELIVEVRRVVVLEEGVDVCPPIVVDAGEVHRRASGGERHPRLAPVALRVRGFLLRVDAFVLVGYLSLGVASPPLLGPTSLPLICDGILDGIALRVELPARVAWMRGSIAWMRIGSAAAAGVLGARQSSRHRGGLLPQRRALEVVNGRLGPDVLLVAAGRVRSRSGHVAHRFPRVLIREARLRPRSLRAVALLLALHPVRLPHKPRHPERPARRARGIGGARGRVAVHPGSRRVVIAGPAAVTVVGRRTSVHPARFPPPRPHHCVGVSSERAF